MVRVSRLDTFLDTYDACSGIDPVVKRRVLRILRRISQKKRMHKTKAAQVYMAYRNGRSEMPIWHKLLGREQYHYRYITYAIALCPDMPIDDIRSILQAHVPRANFKPYRREIEISRRQATPTWAMRYTTEDIQRMVDTVKEFLTDKKFVKDYLSVDAVHSE